MVALNVRVWDDFRKMFLTDRNLRFHFNQDGELVGVDDTYAKVEKFVVQLFTGLLDRNGNKIFEGDIFLTPSGQKRTVIQIDGNYILANDNGIGALLSSCITEDNKTLLKIRGNIFNAN